MKFPEPIAKPSARQPPIAPAKTPMLSHMGLRAMAIAAAYALLATLWILFSDRALGHWLDDPKLLVQASVTKGLAFVALTSAILLLLMRKAFGTIGQGYERMRANEEEIERLNRLYGSLSRVNQAIARTDSREILFERVCRILVEHGHFHMAWIAWPDAEGRILVPAASWGDHHGYLRSIRVSLEDHAEGRGPCGTAFREKRAVVFNDLLSERDVMPWRGEIEREGYRAAAAFPIQEGDRIRGTLSVYADTDTYFQDKEVALLQEVAGDLAFAVRILEEKETRLKAEATARDERAFSATIIESMPGILYFCDEAGRFIRWNRNMETITGYSSSEIARMHPLDFFAESEREAIGERIAEVFAYGEAWAEAPLLDKGGHTTPYHFTGRRVAFDGKPCLLGVGVDISERKRAEAALRDMNACLEQKVEERTGELQRALVRAEGSDRLKSAFLASMSHELRTPLNSIIGFTGILLREMPGPLNDEQKKQLGMVKSSGRHLLDLINDVLDLSKIEAGQLEVRAQRFSLRESLDKVIALTKPQSETKGLALTLAAPPGILEMVGDQRRVEQILLNLANNAVKFTERGHVAIRADIVVDGEVAPAYRIRFSDTGIGIQAADVGKLFLPFRQLDAGLDRQHEGTGLGLAICRRLTHLMNGTMEVESEWGKGSTFTVTLSLETPGSR